MISTFFAAKRILQPGSYESHKRKRARDLIVHHRLSASNVLTSKGLLQSRVRFNQFKKEVTWRVKLLYSLRWSFSAQA